MKSRKRTSLLSISGKFWLFYLVFIVILVGYVALTINSKPSLYDLSQGGF